MELLRGVKRQSKVERAVDLVRSTGEKMIIFTEYRATQDLILRSLSAEGIIAVPYRGGFARNKKDWMMELFRTRARVMVATEAGGEGINLQFCNHIINYDLPWNPMRVEQRIGRVHRLGQEKDVTIYNFSTRDTIEEHILWLLHEKIDMFRMVIGDMETILTKWGSGEEMEQNVMKILLESEDDREIRQRLSALGDTFENARQETTGKKDRREVILMEPTQVESFAERYLTAFDCRILERAPNWIQTELSVEADQDLVHRPFYWMYVEKMGLTPQTTTLTWVFDGTDTPKGVGAELLSYGSPRFNQMLASAQKNGRFVRLYETPPVRYAVGPVPTPTTPGWASTTTYPISVI